MVTLQLEGQEIQLPPEIAISDDAVRKAIAPSSHKPPMPPFSEPLTRMG